MHHSERAITARSFIRRTGFVQAPSRRMPCHCLRTSQTASTMTDRSEKPVERPHIGPREPLPRSFKPLWYLMLALALLVAFVAGASYLVDMMVYR